MVRASTWFVLLCLKMTIKNFHIEYDAINSKNTFTSGDTINGRIILETDKEIVVQSLDFEAKGKARVRWTEHRGQNHRGHNYHGQSNTQIYWAKEKYYSIKQKILREARQDGSEVIGIGRHVFPFSFKIPDGHMPSSFASHIGKIVHKMKAELRQSMKLTKKAEIHFIFVSKTDMNRPGLMDPQHGCQDKSLAFGSGKVSLDAHITKMGYKPGEPINVTVEIINRSSRSVKPKFQLYEKRSYFAQGRRKLETHTILKEKGDDVDSSSSKNTVTKGIGLPSTLSPSILNCSIIKLEYRLKIYLDIKYAADPEVKLPIVILNEKTADRQLPPSGAFGFEAFGNPNHPTMPQAVDLPPPYEASAMYPPLPSADFKSTL
ncbi:arrestin domain-containing protein 3 [Kryptolebias marmoratus]|uniref:Arrestin domain-containing protein 3-like n=1 Tax=Kryptolebias marmoratus TaxID=37003 RepID=A0A3Q3AGI4_KRYMA|nr:arrestin domain-containing protein 3 [Kryptolebias marmoratus]